LPDLTAITFDADDYAASGDNSDADGAYYDDCNDAPDGLSSDWISNDGAGNDTEIWLRLENVDSDFDSMSTFLVDVDVYAFDFTNDTCPLTMQVFDSARGGTENALTDQKEVASTADSTRTQRQVSFGSLTGTKTQWDNAHVKLVWDYTKVQSWDFGRVRLYGTEFTGTYSTASITGLYGEYHGIGE
jgi:hypothetical protein